MILSKFSIKKTTVPVPVPVPVGPARGQYGKYLDRKLCYFILHYINRGGWLLDLTFDCL